MLKHRHPFYEEDDKIFDQKCIIPPYSIDFELSKQNGIDFIANFKEKKLIYWDGTTYLQMFPGVTSTETRLVTDATCVKDWGTREDYENKLFYYNNIERCYVHHANDNADSRLGFDHCNDCAAENLLWKHYINAYPATAAKMDNNVRKFVKKLSDNTNRSLIREHHGKLFDDMYPINALIKMLNLDRNSVKSGRAHRHHAPHYQRNK